MKKMKTEKLFKNIVSKYTNNEHLINTLWYTLITLYSDRPYHNFDHIKNVINELSQVHLENYDSTILAAFYHDIIYDIKNPKENELNSGNFATLELLKIDYPDINNVYNKILATDYNEKVYDYKYQKDEEPELDNDTKYLIDADYSILGSSKYKSYVIAVKKEYQEYPDEIFNKNRILFLKKLLNKNSLFLTKYFKDNYETNALYNITDELKTKIYKNDIF